MVKTRLRAGFGACAMLLAGIGAAAPVPAVAAGSSVKSILANASDGALDKLSQPGAFMADEAVRILLPGPLKKAGKLMKYTDKAGLTTGLSRSLNDAAGLAAGEAKPIFRAAISRMTLQDGVGIVTKGDGATRYLRESAGSELQAKIRSLILSALGKTGAFKQMDRLGGGNAMLAGLGLSHDGLTDSVTEQALNGIFTYIGAEESKLRANPLKLLKGLN